MLLPLSILDKKRQMFFNIVFIISCFRILTYGAHLFCGRIKIWAHRLLLDVNRLEMVEIDWKKVYEYFQLKKIFTLIIKYFLIFLMFKLKRVKIKCQSKNNRFCSKITDCPDSRFFFHKGELQYSDFYHRLGKLNKFF